jgi:hypothetical protein
MKREGSFVYGYCWSDLKRANFIDTFYSNQQALQITVEEVDYKKIQPPTYFKQA